MLNLVFGALSPNKISSLSFQNQFLEVPLWKLTVTAFILWIGCFLYGYKVIYKDLWKLALMLEPVFILPELIKVSWFMISKSDPSYWDISAFYPLSAINFFDYTLIAPKWYYPLKAINIFEICYWVLISYGIFFLSGKKLKISFAITFSSYVLFFLLWLGFYVITY